LIAISVDLRHREKAVDVLAFTLGTEMMQMLVVAVVLPLLILISRTNADAIFRIGGVVFAKAASLRWMLERLGHIETPLHAAAF
jgi:hypothetical protein